MRKIRIFEHISLDGVIEHEDGYAYGAWTTPYRTPVGLALVLEAYGASFDLLLGRHTYDLWSRLLAEGGKQSNGGQVERSHEIHRHSPA